MKRRLQQSFAAALLTAVPAAVAQQPAPATENPTLRKLDERNQSELEESLALVSDIARQQEAAERERRRLEATEREAGVTTAQPPPVSPPAAAEAADRTPPRTPTPPARQKQVSAPPSRGTRVTFDKITPPPVYDPVVRRKPVVESGVLQAGITLAPPQNDPKNPDKPLDKSDPLARTYHSRQGVEVTTQTFWLSADELDYRVPAGEEGGGFGLPAGTAKPKKGAVDPVNPGAADDDEPPFEWAEARGRAKVRRLVNGTLQEGFGALIRYDQKTGDILLTGFPEIIQGKQRIIGKAKDAKIVLKANGEEPWTENCRFSSIDPDAKSQPNPPSPSPKDLPGASPAPATPAGGRDAASPEPPASSAKPAPRPAGRRAASASR